MGGIACSITICKIYEVTLYALTKNVLDIKRCCITNFLNLQVPSSLEALLKYFTNRVFGGFQANLATHRT